MAVEAPPEAAAVVLDGVSKRFGSGAAEVAAVEDVSLRVAPGEFTAIVGPSGCGKTTLLRMLAGLLEPSSGTILLDDRPVAGQQRAFGIVYQKPVLLPWRTVFSNVMLAVEIQGDDGDRAALRSRARDLLQEVGLEGFEKSYSNQLSIGMQQRVALCRALVMDPRVLLMDEPFAALDAMTRERMGLLLHSVWLANRKTAFFVTHSIPEAVLLSTTLVAMSARPGRIAKRFEVDLPIPRTLDLLGTPRCVELMQEVRRAVMTDALSIEEEMEEQPDAGFRD
jgi:NitT/TauT family transport system ATP-binding protein